MKEPEYYEIRHIKGETTQIEVDNGRLESGGTSFFDVAVIRVLGDSGWGVVSVDTFDPDNKKKLNEYLAQGMALASITGEKVKIEPTEAFLLPVPSLKENPTGISLEEKADLLMGIERSAKIDSIVSTRANYIEKHEEVLFFDSSGKEFTYNTTRCGFNVLAVAGKNGLIQMASEREHTIEGFNLRHKAETGLLSAELAVSLLDAKPAKALTVNAVLDPELAGVFAHEAVGHAGEGDLVLEGSSVLKGRIGEDIGPDFLTISDDPTLPLFGFEPVDAEGSTVVKTDIVRNGKINAFLHNRETLCRIGDGQLGHARAMAGSVPIVRMSNTFIENGDAKREELFSECREGVYLKGSRGGQVDPGRGVFQFNAEYGYLIENGECTRMIRDVSLSGEILSTLHSILLCANDRQMNEGYCGKGGQSVPVSDGAPHILLSNAVVGGSVVD